MQKIISFGEQNFGKEYITRPGAYGIIFNTEKNKIAITKHLGKYFLIGGGVEEGETPEDCLRREFLEEAGWYVKIEKYIGTAQRYFYSTNQYEYMHSIGDFYVCQRLEGFTEPIEQDHEICWVEPQQAAGLLFHEHQSWAVKQALELVI
ncbi:NUDIX hydrolase [Bacillus sp. T33-2]|uniref:NUDIX hydrolase n=1 Tax=Bacillus sp. T33-2 TaxID=2054168 RepID=UPI0015E09943|nr:NUDIX domain-containing protein [Bacillus sp. T33-2]